MLFPDIVQSVGRTPMVELRHLDTAARTIFVKMESRNPCGSVKDRVGAALIEDAERRGVLKPGAMLVEPTSGNTGIALAFVAAAKGYALTLIMPERISQERVALLRMLGAEIVFTPGSLMREAVAKAEELVAATPGAVMLQQFKNPANPEIHRRTTAEEIWADLDGEVDVFVSGVGTGGTITGVGEVLKARRPGCRIVAVEPASAAVLSGRAAGHAPPAGPRRRVRPRDPQPRGHRRGGGGDRGGGGARAAPARAQGGDRRRHVERRGAPRGADRSRRRPEMSGKRIVVVLPDGGERYATNAVFADIARKVGSGAG